MTGYRFPPSAFVQLRTDCQLDHFHSIHQVKRADGAIVLGCMGSERTRAPLPAELIEIVRVTSEIALLAKAQLIAQQPEEDWRTA